MIIVRSFCLAFSAAAYLGLASQAMAYDSRHHAIHPVSTFTAAGVPIAQRTTAQVLYVVPVVPIVRGIRAAPVGQPVIYVIEQPDEEELGNDGRRSDAGVIRGEEFDASPRITTIDP